MKELKIVTPNIETNIIKILFSLKVILFFKIDLIVKGNNIKKANDHLKKLNLKGVKSLLYAIFPKKKFPDQNREEISIVRTQKIIAY